MNKIRENIYLGGADDAKYVDVLKDRGITAVLNVALDVADQDFFSQGITNVKVALGDCDYNPTWKKELAVDTLGKLLDAGQIVYVHCFAGASRAPYVVGKYLARKEGRPLQDVMNEIHALRPEAFERSPLHDE